MFFDSLEDQVFIKRKQSSQVDDFDLTREIFSCSFGPIYSHSISNNAARFSICNLVLIGLKNDIPFPKGKNVIPCRLDCLCFFCPRDSAPIQTLVLKHDNRIWIKVGSFHQTFYIRRIGGICDLNSLDRQQHCFHAATMIRTSSTISSYGNSYNCTNRKLSIR